MASDLRLATPAANARSCSPAWALPAATWAPAPCCPHHRAGPGGGAALHRPRDDGEEGERWGFWNALHAPEALEAEAMALARHRRWTYFAHGITKTQLNQEWNMGLEQAIEAEAQAQAICMQTRDFERAYRAFVAKEKPVFQGD
jgi:enoyl-CoA hydratase/carnithine racemase